MSAQRSGSRNRVGRSVAHGGRLKRMRKVKPTRGTAIFALFRDPSLLPPRMRISMYRIDFWRFQQQRFFRQKLEKDSRHGGICCSRRRVKMTSRKRQPRDGTNLAPTHFFCKSGEPRSDSQMGARGKQARPKAGGIWPTGSPVLK